MFHSALEVKVIMKLPIQYTLNMSFVGKIFQYRKEEYGKFYSNLPKSPYSEFPNVFTTMHNQLLGLSLSKLEAIKNLPLIERIKNESMMKKKYILFCTDEKLVENSKYKKIACMYLQCMVTDPYTEELKTVWVRLPWLEEFVDDNYDGKELNETIRNIKNFLNKSNRPKKDPNTMAEEMKKLIRLYRQI